MGDRRRADRHVGNGSATVTALTQTEILGDKKMHRELVAAIVDLRDLTEPGREAQRIALNAARSEAPRLTGRLAASHKAGRVTEHEAPIVATVVYAPVIHWGWARRGIEANPWMTRAARRTEPTWVRGYAEQTDSAISKVKGLSR